MKTFKTVFFQTQGVWVGKAIDLPGAITQGFTLQEAKENLKEAIELVWVTLQAQFTQDIPRDVPLYHEDLELQLGRARDCV